MILKIGHLAKAMAHAKAITFAKCSVWVKNQKCQKHAKNHCTRTLELFCAKNRSKKHQLLEKLDDFENRPSCKGYSPCKAYSLYKMLSLGQKLKMPKTCKKTFYKSIRVVLRKKTAGIKTKCWRNETTLKISPCKGYSLCEMLSLGQKLKMPKTCQKPFYKNIRVVLRKNRSKKHQILEK